MIEIYLWVRLCVADEEDFSLLSSERVHIKNLAKQSKIDNDVIFINGCMMAAKILNHSHQVRPYIELYKDVSELLPYSYGLLYYNDDEEVGSDDADKFYVLRMARGKIEKFNDPFLSPYSLVIGD